MIARPIIGPRHPVFGTEIVRGREDPAPLAKVKGIEHFDYVIDISLAMTIQDRAQNQPE